MAWLTRCWLRMVVWLNAHLKSASVRFTRWTHKSDVPIHPKHLAKADSGEDWYLPFVEQDSVVLDAGCASGVHSLRVARAGCRVLALDKDHDALRAARRLIGESNSLPLLFVLTDLSRPIPAVDGAFNAVLLLDVLEHLVAREQLLAEIHRVLQPSGKLLLSAPNRDTRWKRRLRAASLPSMTDPDHKIEYTWEELVAELRAGGFRVVAGPFPIVYDTPWAGVIDLVGGISLSAYRHLARWKVSAARQHPAQTTGWRVVCERMDDR